MDQLSAGLGKGKVRGWHAADWMCFFIGVDGCSSLKLIKGERCYVLHYFTNYFSGTTKP